MDHDEELIRLAARLARTAAVDDTSGLANLRQLLRDLARELARAGRTGSTIQIMIVEPAEIDDPAEIGQQVRSILRREDVAARVAGRRYAVVCTDLSEYDGATVARRLQEALGGRARPPLGRLVIAGDRAAHRPVGEYLDQALGALEEARASLTSMATRHLDAPRVN